jgi:hypothetical protein
MFNRLLKRLSPVPRCPRCNTPIADEEGVYCCIAEESP